MTRKHVNRNADLVIRSRRDSQETEVDMFVDQQLTPSSSNEGQVTFDYNQMYHFMGDETNVYPMFPNHNMVLPYSLPTMQFPAPQVTHEDEEAQQHLLWSYISAELVDVGVAFEEYRHPFMNDSVADEYGQPQWNLPNTDNEISPVYPQNRPGPLVLPPGDTWFSGAFGNEDSQPRIAPRPYRRLLPNGDRRPSRAAPVDAGDLGPSTVRGRKRPLSPDSRAAARDVRMKGACARCHKKREKCDMQRPCRPCLGKLKRSLDIPCMQELPEDRWQHLFTDAMYGHLEFKAISRDMPKADPNQASFEIRLHQYFDDPELYIPVRPFNPSNSNDVRKSIFPIGRNTTGYVVQQTEIISPPLVPALTPTAYRAFQKRFYWSVRRWLDQAEIHDDLGWNGTFYRPEYGKIWPRDVLGTVCKFYHSVTKSGCPVLKSCLQSTVLVYMIGHSFYIPAEDHDEVLSRTFGPSYTGESEITEWVSPIYVDRFLKILLFPIFKACVKAALRGLQSLYSPPKPSPFIRDRILAASLVLLMVSASQQVKAIEKALARHRQGYDVNTDDVFDQIREIEHDIVNMIVELWQYKFPAGCKLVGSDDPRNRFNSERARDFNLIESFRLSYLDCPDRKPLQDLPTELPANLDSKKFGIYNTERVLKKFYVVVFPRVKEEVEVKNEVALPLRS